ncbi:MAG: glycosyltransferase [Balneolaceae bacterium]|nr:glycosyltransferase [Balneolaceae bacterium]
MKLSVVIPVLDEEGVIGPTVRAVLERATEAPEIVVADGGSSDGTVREALEAGAGRVIQAPRGRARQMNAGASTAEGEVLYFLHADTLPPEGFDRQIASALASGCSAGCFRLSFRPSHPLLEIYAWFTRFDVDAFRFGDQSLYVTHRLFNRSGGFREDHYR